MFKRNPLTIAVRCLLFAALLFALVNSLVPPCSAQSSSSTLSGTVEDQNGGLVAGASVMVINTATGLQRTATTNEQGGFTIPLLPPATYKVRVERQGFSPVEVPTVVLNVGDQKALRIQLKAGDVNATVTVQSDAETIRADGSVGTIINRQQVANMPLNGRSLHALIQLTPGVVLTPASGSGATGSTQFSVNGQRTTSNYFMVDGVSANTGMGAADLPGASGSGQAPGTTALGGTNSLVSLDALQEFRIDTSSYAAEFGRTPGGQISLVTRGGTNQFHGSASYYFRNEALDANDWFANATRQPKPRERQNLFSGVLGGPIKLDRLFFFASYEGLRLKQPQVQVKTVATVALRAQAVPELRPYLNALPLPNGQDFGNGTAQFAGSYSDPGKFNIFAVRVDGQIADNLTGFFRVNHAPSQAQSRTSSLSTVKSISVSNDTYTGGLVWVAGSRLTIDVRSNWSRNAPRVVFDLDTFGGAQIPTVSDVFLDSLNPSKGLQIFIGPGGGRFDWGTANNDIQRQFNTVGTLAWLVGAHQLKMGVDYRRLLPLVGATNGLIRSVVFSTAQRVTTGLASSYATTSIDPIPREAIFENISLFAQDTWRVHPGLTLTYGFRFERVPPPSEASGRLPRTLLGIDSDILQNPRLAPLGTPLFHRRFGEFAPRFGVAYQLSTRQGWETTLRGGAGIFYDIGLGEIASGFQRMYPFFAIKAAANVPFPPTGAVATPPVLGVDPPQQLFLPDPNLQMPYTAQWNASLDQGIGQAQTVTISYIGAAGRRLLVNQNYFQPLAEWPTVKIPISIQRNVGQSSYNALQAQYRRRLRQGLEALASYTLANSRDNGSADNALAPPASQTAIVTQEYGPSNFDVRHILSAALSYDLPRMSAPMLLRAVASDWGLDLLIRYQSAFPVTPRVGSAFFPDGAFYNQRPDVVAGQPLYINDPTIPGGRRFNRTAFVVPAGNQQGNFSRNGLRGFPASQVDLALRREFRLRESVRLQLRAEVFNLFNHPNFAIPVADISDGLFGQPTSMLNRSLGGLNALYQMGGPRSGQLAIKILF